MNGSIRKRSRNSWELTIDLGRDEQGKRRRKFISVTGTKNEAQRQLREYLSTIDKGIPLNAEKATVAQWLDRWLKEYVVPNTRQKTVERYEGIIRNHVKPELGNLRLAKLSPSDIQSLEAKLIQAGMAPAGVELVHRVISSALKYAVRMEVLWRNAAQAVTPPKVVRREIEPPDVLEVRRILTEAIAQNHPLYAAIHLIAYTGIRRGEALGLRWQDIDLEAGTISIVQTLGRSLHKGLVFQPPKTNRSRRSIDLDPGTVDVLRAHKVKQLEHRLLLGEAYQDTGLVFPDPLGAPLNPMALTRAFQSLAHVLGLKELRLHDLRHFHASVMLQQRQSPALVSQRLGHASVSTTMDIYSHILPGWQKEAANAFAKAMGEG